MITEEEVESAENIKELHRILDERKVGHYILVTTSPRVEGILVRVPNIENLKSDDDYSGIARFYLKDTGQFILLDELEVLIVGQHH